jgi:hypothetical protein
MSRISISAWICLVHAIPAGVMMKPSWVSLFVAAAVLGGTFLIRFVAFREGIVAGRLERGVAP